jgi:hypothetical protein
MNIANSKSGNNSWQFSSFDYGFYYYGYFS